MRNYLTDHRVITTTVVLNLMGSLLFGIVLLTATLELGYEPTWLAHAIVRAIGALFVLATLAVQAQLWLLDDAEADEHTETVQSDSV